MEHLGTQHLETDRLILRGFARTDAQAMYANWASDDRVTRFLTWPTHSSVAISQMVLDDWVSHYGEKDYYQWAIVLKDLDQPIGSIAAVQVDDRTEKVEIGYCIGRQWWHQGIASEALSKVIRFFLEDVKAKRVQARHDTRNTNSGAVMRKCGLVYEGTLRQADRNNQGVCDSCIYAILASDERGTGA